MVRARGGTALALNRKPLRPRCRVHRPERNVSSGSSRSAPFELCAMHNLPSSSEVDSAYQCERWSPRNTLGSWLRPALTRRASRARLGLVPHTAAPPRRPVLAMPLCPCACALLLSPRARRQLGRREHASARHHLGRRGGGGSVFVLDPEDPYAAWRHGDDAGVERGGRDGEP